MATSQANQKVYVSPGVYTSETDLSFVAQSVGVTTLGLVGETIKGPAFEPIFITNYDEFQAYFGGTEPVKLPVPVNVSCALPSLTLNTVELPEISKVASEGDTTETILNDESLNDGVISDPKSYVFPLFVYFHTTANVAGLIVMEGLETEPVKLSTPVSLSCALPSVTFVTFDRPVSVTYLEAYEGVIDFILMVYVKGLEEV